MTGLWWSLPWWLATLVFLSRVRLPRPLPADGASSAIHAASDAPPEVSLVDRGSALDARRPQVSVIIPARNESRNIVAVLESLSRSRGPSFEVLVVDDRSEDDTAERARGVAAGHADRIEVIDGAPLPEGWLGKNWACHQGVQQARGSVLLFTDADTVHGPDLLRRVLSALDEDRADALTLAGRQLMGSFWERLVQPQIFMGILTRYPNTRRRLPAERWRDAIANGQYVLLRREIYDAIGGHASVRGEVVEDMRLAQRLVRLGYGLTVRSAEDGFATRMYTSLAELVEGWSKNILLGGLATLPEGWVRRLAPLAAVVLGTVSFVLPPVLTLGLGVGSWLASAATPTSASGGWAAMWPILATNPLFAWGASLTLLGMGFWSLVSWRMRIAPGYGLLYPLGAAVAQYIYLRTWRRGGHVEWKGRRYDLDPATVTREPEAV